MQPQICSVVAILQSYFRYFPILASEAIPRNTLENVPPIFVGAGVYTGIVRMMEGRFRTRSETVEYSMVLYAVVTNSGVELAITTVDTV
jgi:hypothetical protein